MYGAAMSSEPFPVASVIVPSHRGAHRLPVLLHALSRQDCEEPWEVVVVLDGVLDDTPAVLAQWQDRIMLRVITHDQPRGVVHALNAGYGAARGRVLIRCDDDLTPAPHMVRGHVRHHRERDDVGVSCPMRDVPVDTAFGRTYGTAAGRLRLQQWYSRPPDRRWVDWSAHNSITRDAWNRLDHGFDPRFVYGQDSELGYRLARSGVGIIVDPSLEIEHRGTALSAANRVPRAFVAGSSRALFRAVHGVSHEERSTEDTITLGQRSWRLGVLATALVLRRWTQFVQLGRIVEVVAPRLPSPAGRRLTALAVEAAGRSGLLHGPPDLASLAGQKSREIARERLALDASRSRQH